MSDIDEDDAEALQKKEMRFRENMARVDALLALDVLSDEESEEIAQTVTILISFHWKEIKEKCGLNFYPNTE